MLSRSDPDCVWTGPQHTYHGTRTRYHTPLVGPRTCTSPRTRTNSKEYTLPGISVYFLPNLSFFLYQKLHTWYVIQKLPGQKFQVSKHLLCCHQRRTKLSHIKNKQSLNQPPLIVYFFVNSSKKANGFALMCSMPVHESRPAQQSSRSIHYCKTILCLRGE